MGERYWINPRVDNETVSVAFPNKNRGIAVAGPAPINKSIVVKSKDSFTDEVVKVDIKNPNAMGVINSVSIVRAGKALIFAIFLSNPYPEKEKAKNNAMYGNFP